MSDASAVPGPLEPPEALARLQDLADSAADYVAASKAPATRAAYRRWWRTFTEWCDTAGLQSLPAAPEAVALFAVHLTDKLGRKPSTVGQAMAALAAAHKAAGHPTPTTSPKVKAVLAGIRRKHGTAQRQVRPVMASDLVRMVQAQPETLKGLRDAALLLVGFAGGFRRSELVAIDVEDLEFTEDGVIVRVRRSKTDQEGSGREVGIPFGSRPVTCPVRALRRWLRAADIGSGAVFVGVRHGRLTGRRLRGVDVARVVKSSSVLVGLDPATYSGHSLRSGLATSAAKAGRSEMSIMRQTGHRSVGTLRRYVRHASTFIDNAAAGLL